MECSRPVRNCHRRADRDTVARIKLTPAMPASLTTGFTICLRDCAVALRTEVVMRAIALLWIVCGVALLGSRARAGGVMRPRSSFPARPGVPVIINGGDASYCVVEGDWGLDRPGHAADRSGVPAVSGRSPSYEPPLFPGAVRAPARLRPPRDRATAESASCRQPAPKLPPPVGVAVRSGAAERGDPPANVDVTSRRRSSGARPPRQNSKQSQD